MRSSDNMMVIVVPITWDGCPNSIGWFFPYNRNHMFLVFLAFYPTHLIIRNLKKERRNIIVTDTVPHINHIYLKINKEKERKT